MGRKAAGDFGGQVCLRRLVGGGDRVALLVVLELDLEFHSGAPPEMARQYLAGAAGQLNGVALDFEYLRVVWRLHGDLPLCAYCRGHSGSPVEKASVEQQGRAVNRQAPEEERSDSGGLIYEIPRLEAMQV